ncbi:TonB-dependent receptor domain-containing protein [Wenzhouxiangella marina]|uniref:TonB-dependent receptor n=1 Tax=Wenzhouxiangella marina TaxID=1579979 RepID=A0A0K0XU35_9GAMM|nr:TonB-dependent receptor [Wenzhouxiangella marina]AKS41142.1 TonB-dependent receptor [Wenzhouxiangella marina]MBB6088021.1 hemoglobin/transferrin/lactoferrin receptor protein [Wenzhouxiangella marina]
MRSAMLLGMTLLLSAIPTTTVRAQHSDSSEEEALALDALTVVAHRQPRSLSEVAGTVTVIGASRIEQELAFDVRDLVRYEPGVEVDGGGTRFGAGGFRIRGVGGNRTAVVVDGVPLSNRFAVGNYADSGRGLLELGLVERVELLRGPASTLYGSKALGGVVSLNLLDAEDLLYGEDQAMRYELAGSSADDRWRSTAALAARRGDVSGLLAATHQQARQIEVAARPVTVPEDRLDRTQQSVLLRLAGDFDAGRLRLSFDALRDERDSDLRALLGQGRFRTTTELFGDDRNERWRLLLDQDLAPGPVWERGQWRLWHQVSDIRQDSFEARPLARTPVDLFRRFDFRETSQGAAIDLETSFDLFGLDQRLGYGMELIRSDLRQSRDALETVIATGESRPVVLGEHFPLRDFPLTELTEFGAYLHDEIRLWRGGPTLSPGLRFEYYELDSQGDPVYEQAFPDTPLTDLDSTAWTPKLGLVWPLGSGAEVFAQYARGFRSPPFSDVNIGLDIPQFGIRAIPNPDLEPERGRTLEAGVRWRGASTRLDLAVFRNQYQDFISTRALVGVDPDGILLFQSINRDRVRIEGAELRARQQIGDDFGLSLAAEWMRGEDQSDGRSLPDLSPPQAIVSLDYTPSPVWRFLLAGTFTRDQRRLLDEAGDPLFAAPASAVFDLLGQWSPWPDLSISAGLFNIDDRQTWTHANVLGRPADDPTLPLLADPGRHARLMLRWLH